MVEIRVGIAIATTSRGFVVRAAQAIAAGETLFSFAGATRVRERSAYTVEIAENVHICDQDVLAKINHSCEPNLEVDCALLVYRALRAIASGDDLSYFYPSTESVMGVPFRCSCGSSRCIGVVLGASELAPETLAGYFINPHALRGRR